MTELLLLVKTAVPVKQCRSSFIVIDNADNLINDDVRGFINFEVSNQYMLFLRNCDGLNVSDKSFKVRCKWCLEGELLFEYTRGVT